LSDNGVVFHCVLTNRLGTNISADALLTVLADTNAPSLFSVVNLNSNVVQVTTLPEQLTSSVAQLPPYSGGVN
jgi:hypothetical protein